MAAMTDNAIRGALEPFAKAAGYFDNDERARVGLAPAPDNLVGGYGGVQVGDLRRARTAYDASGAGVKALPGHVAQHYGHLGSRIAEFFDKDETAGSFLREDGDGGFVGGLYRMAREIDALRSLLSPVEVEEADAKAGEPMAFLVHNPIVDNIVRERESLFPASRESDAREFAKLLRADCTPLYAATPSTPSPQPREAGAGPVGEAVAYARGVLESIRDFCGEHRTDTNLNRVSAMGVDVAIMKLAAHPVEEPGEVERFDFDAHSLKVDLARETKRAEIAEAALTETRERINQLAYVERYAEDAEARAAAAERALETVNTKKAMLVEAINDAIVTGSVAPLRAALTGDAQEAGK